jgi:hypothetical protein
MRELIVAIALVIVAVPGCSHRQEIPDDPRLEVFIDTMARCAHVDRAYSGNPEMLARELDRVEIPPNWSELVDSLMATYGGDPDFWTAVYGEILKRSRLPSD